MRLQFACALAGALVIGATGAANACQPGDARLAGHYYLNGVMEVGSELLLKKDGSFEFALAYGANDQYGKGCWVRKGSTVEVIPADPEDKERTAAILARFGELCAAAHGVAVRLRSGEADHAVYHRTKPWDHAPGSLLLREAGGVVGDPGGRPYRPQDAEPRRLVSAADATTYDLVRGLLPGSR